MAFPTGRYTIEVGYGASAAIPGETAKNGMTPVLAIDGGGIRIPYVWTIKGLENSRVLISGGTAYGKGEQFVTRSYNGPIYGFTANQVGTEWTLEYLGSGEFRIRSDDKADKAWELIRGAAPPSRVELRPVSDSSAQNWRIKPTEPGV
jgi:hypothetical protein